MTIYNSQRVNNDPKPYLWQNGERTAEPSVWGNRPGHIHHPRPEYDNNPNPILEAFRAVSEHPRGGLVALAERGLNNHHGLWDEEIIGRSHQDHARRVLTKLINVYKETA